MATTKTKTRVEYEAVASGDAVDDDEWRVEGIDYENEGLCYIAIFSGPQAKERAKEYARWKNS